MAALWLLIVLTVGPEGDIRAAVISESRHSQECFVERARALKMDHVLGAVCVPVSAELYTTLRGSILRFGGK